MLVLRGCIGNVGLKLLDEIYLEGLLLFLKGLSSSRLALRSARRGGGE